MNWFNILKVDYPNPEAHETPEVGKYIKYLSNLIDESHRYSFKKWWSFGSIRTDKPEGYDIKEHDEELRDSSTLPSKGLEHMKSYHERVQGESTAKLSLAGNLFDNLIQNLDNLMDQVRKGKVQSAQLPRERARKLLLEVLNDMKASNPKLEFKETHHGLTIRLWPDWLPTENVSTEMHLRGPQINNLRIRFNLSHETRDTCVDYMIDDKKISEVCFRPSDTNLPSGDYYVGIIMTAFSNQRQFEQMIHGQQGQQGRWRFGQKQAVSPNRKDWWYGRKDREFYVEGLTIIREAHRDLLKINTAQNPHPMYTQGAFSSLSRRVGPAKANLHRQKQDIKDAGLSRLDWGDAFEN
tara:strand:+ start:462 stop:1517 length:1056 start_codon:yes stop_codon:yes gene_type:complete